MDIIHHILYINDISHVNNIIHFLLSICFMKISTPSSTSKKKEDVCYGVKRTLTLFEMIWTNDLLAPNGQQQKVIYIHNMNDTFNIEIIKYEARFLLQLFLFSLLFLIKILHCGLAARRPLGLCAFSMAVMPSCAGCLPLAFCLLSARRALTGK